MREDKRQQMMAQVQQVLDSMDTRCTPATDITFVWSEEGIGFGEFTFYQTAEDDKIHCSNETMSKEWIKATLCRMVDECVLDEPPRKKEDG